MYKFPRNPTRGHSRSRARRGSTEDRSRSSALFEPEHFLVRRCVNCLLTKHNGALPLTLSSSDCAPCSHRSVWHSLQGSAVGVTWALVPNGQSRKGGLKCAPFRKKGRQALTSFILYTDDAHPANVTLNEYFVRALMIRR